MKRLMLVGPVGCGKTTLLQRLNDVPLEAQKTQAVELVGEALDTPGEYLENRRLSHALSVTAAEADVVALVLNAGFDQLAYAPEQAEMFACPVIGIITKIDQADPEAVAAAKAALRHAGAQEIFAVSSLAGTGLAELQAWLDS